MYKRVVISVVVCLALAGYAMAQTNPQNPQAAGQPSSAQGSPQASAQPATPGTAAADSPAPPKGNTAAKPKDDAAPAAAPNHASVNATKIPSGSKVYVAPMGGFENYVVAGILKKKVPVTIVADRDKADFEIKGSAETEKAGWAKMLFLSSDSSNEQASINVTEIKSGNIVFAYSVHKANSVRGKQSAGEAIGKHLNEAMGKD